MIHIDQDQKRIVLSEAAKEPLSFSLLMGYICPICKKIILAYWQDNNSPYNPLDFVGEQSINPYTEYYTAFRVPFARGIELRNHKCNNIYSFLNLEENIRTFIRQIDYNYSAKDKPIPLKEHTQTEILEFLRSYGVTFIPDICGREAPMLQMDKESIEGQWDTKQPYDTYKIQKTLRVNQFLVFFGLQATT
jgi:hypothetical protein